MDFAVNALVRRPPRAAFTAAELGHATLMGFANVRLFFDAPLAEVIAAKAMFQPQTGAEPANYLALSAGGEGGAYGAGFLNGWSLRGDRPQFDLVTGVSAGALIAPFAFVGTSADERLTKFFQDVIQTQFGAHRSLISGMLGPSWFSAEPFADLIARAIDAPLIAQVAQRHNDGARLLVLTTCLDSGRGVIWNLGAIAASNHPEKTGLFCRILRASASIPALFPPTLVQSDANGTTLTELHVDGGAIRQVFFFPDVVFSGEAARQILPNTPPKLHVIANQRLHADFSMAHDQTFATAHRAYQILIRSSTISALIAEYEFAKRYSLPFRVTSIDEMIVALQNGTFDKAYMARAFEHGQKNGKSGKWETPRTEAYHK